MLTLQKFISHLLEKKLNRFLIYALGEITLIVIGILLAGKFNNWNDERKAVFEEQILLNDLRDEMKGNGKQLDQVIYYNELSRDAASMILERYTNSKTTTRKPTIDSLLAQIQWAWTFNPRLGVVNSIKADGKINIIQNLAIRSFITTFEETSGDVLEESLVTRSLIVDQYVFRVNKYVPLADRDKFIGYRLPTSRFTSDYAGLFNDRELESLIAYINIWRVSEIEGLKKLKKFLEDNIRIVESEIKK